MAGGRAREIGLLPMTPVWRTCRSWPSGPSAPLPLWLGVAFSPSRPPWSPAAAPPASRASVRAPRVLRTGPPAPVHPRRACAPRAVEEFALHAHAFAVRAKKPGSL